MQIVSQCAHVVGLSCIVKLNNIIKDLLNLVGYSTCMHLILLLWNKRQYYADIAPEWYL